MTVRDLPLRGEGPDELVSLRVVPIAVPGDKPYFVVLFERGAREKTPSTPASGRRTAQAKSAGRWSASSARPATTCRR